jgi:hypothetical protein
MRMPLVLVEKGLVAIGATRERPNTMAALPAPDQSAQPLSSYKNIQALRLVHFRHR